VSAEEKVTKFSMYIKGEQGVVRF